MKKVIKKLINKWHEIASKKSKHKLFINMLIIFSILIVIKTATNRLFLRVGIYIPGMGKWYFYSS